MELFLTMVQLQLMLFTLIIAGIIVKKTGILDEKSRKALSDLLINIILPCNIINSFIGDLVISSELMENCVIAIIISILIQLFATYGSRLFFLKFPREEKSIMSYGMILL